MLNTRGSSKKKKQVKGGPTLQQSPAKKKNISKKNVNQEDLDQMQPKPTTSASNTVKGKRKKKVQEAEVNDRQQSCKRSKKEAVRQKEMGERESPARMIPFGYEKPTKVTFIDHGHVMNMSVGPAHDEIEEQDEEVDYIDDVDNEVSFRHDSESNPEQSSQSSRSRGQTDSEMEADENDDGQVSSGESEQGVYHDGDEEQNKRDVESFTTQEARRKRIKEIDHEMKSRVIELQELVKLGGLSGTKTEIQKLRMMTQGGDSDKGKNFNRNSNKYSRNSSTNRRVGETSRIIQHDCHRLAQ